MVPRLIQTDLMDALGTMPAVALLGPRQVGKTTLAIEISQSIIHKETSYLDLDLDSGLAKLDDAEAYLRRFENQLLIIDEVQNKPDLFPVLRGLIDVRIRAGEPTGQFLLLGSASRDLLQRSAETLAGRIRYLELKPFSVSEIATLDLLEFSPEKLWFRGGFPKSYLAPSDQQSWQWRSDFLESYVQRDLPKMGPSISPERMDKFWKMLSHLHGQQINFSNLGKSLEVSHTTVRNYLDILSDLYMARQLQPWSGNTKKRIVKSPKIYLRDSGLLHRLLGITEYDHLLGHPIVGFSWEGFVIESILNHLSDSWNYSYYRSTAQSEIDLVLEKSNREVWAIEIKRTSSPKLTPGFHRASEDIKATKKFVVYSGNDSYPISGNTEVIGLVEFLKLLDR